ncbi:MAG: glycosyltransferase family 87 protein [Caldilineaceae bacterium]
MQSLNAALARFQRGLDRRTRPRYLQVISLLIITLQLCALVVIFATQQNNKTIFGPLLGADFTSFYNAGTIFNEQGASQVYVSAVQDANYRRLFPAAPPNTHLPYANAPFLTLLFTLFARLPYPAAYFGWLLLSLSFYVTGFLLLWDSLDGLPRHRRPTALLLALSFMPFLIEGWTGGQTSTLAFLCLALAIYLERRNLQLASGAVLALCAFKPTLLLLIGPMLLLTRRWRTLVGFTGATAFLGGISWLTFGQVGLVNYVDMLLFFKRAAVGAQSGLKIWKYIDINAFFRMILADYPAWQPVAAGAVMVVGGAALVWLWWRTSRGDADAQAGLWALTITGTLVLNMYNGFYEATLLVLSLLLFTHVLYRRAAASDHALNTGYKSLLLLLYLTPWVSQPLAKVTGVQIFTLMLLAVGIYQWRVASGGLRVTHNPPLAARPPTEQVPYLRRILVSLTGLGRSPFV